MNQVKSHKQKVYCIPGLGASNKIFEFFPKSDLIEYHFLEQQLAHKGESFESYIDRWAKLISAEDPVLIGVSFGGIIAQELTKRLKVKKLILISSVRSPKAYPWFLKLFKYTGLHKLVIPFILYKVKRIKERPKTKYEQKMNPFLNRYLPHIDADYIKWSVREIVYWNPTTAFEPTVQLHGTRDEVFPYSKTKNAIPVKDGTHSMIIAKRNWFERELLSYIED